MIPQHTRNPVKPAEVLSGRPILQQTRPLGSGFRLLSTEPFRRAFPLSNGPHVQSGMQAPLADERPISRQVFDCLMPVLVVHIAKELAG